VHRLAQTCLHLQSYRMSRYAPMHTHVCMPTLVRAYMRTHTMQRIVFRHYRDSTIYAYTIQYNRYILYSCVHLNRYTYINTHAHTHARTCVCVCVCVCMYYIAVYAHARTVRRMCPSLYMHNDYMPIRGVQGRIRIYNTGGRRRGRRKEEGQDRGGQRHYWY